jgi:O-antigen/teichoic acid export membrane protein
VTTYRPTLIIGRYFMQQSENLFSKSKPALLTILTNGLAMLIKFAVTLLSIRLLIGYIGSEMYGLITTIMTMCIWLNTIADGGIGLSLKNAILKLRTTDNDTIQISELASSAFFMILSLTLLLNFSLALLIPSLNWHSILNIQVNITSTQLIFFIITMLASTLLLIPFNLPKLIYAAYQKEYLFSFWLFLGSIIGIIWQIICIHYNYGLVLAGSAIQLGSLLAALLGTVWFIHKQQLIKWHLLKANWTAFRLLLSPSLDFFILQFTALAIFQSGIFITNYFLGQQAAATYALHYQIFAYFQIVTSLIITPFWSAMGEAYHQKNQILFKKFVVYLTTFIGLLSLLFGIVVMLGGNYWISLLSHHQVSYSPALMLILALFQLLSITSGTVTTALLSVGDTHIMRKMLVLQAILNIILSAGLVQLYGILGCALGLLFSTLLTTLWYSPWRMKCILRTWPI